MLSSAVAAIAVRVSVLSIFAPTHATVTDGKRARVLEARGNVLLVDGTAQPVLRLGGAGVTVALPKRDFVRRYPGALEARARDGALELVVDLPDEEYLPGTVALEAGGAHPEALRAQAIVARTFLARGSRHPGSGYHLCDLTHCMTWRGLDGETEGARAAVADTTGLLVRAGPNVAEVYFSAACGGATANKTDVWGGEARPYLRSVPCDACRGAPDYRWKADVEDIALWDSLRKRRPEEIRVRAGRILGWNVIRSNAFTVEKRGERWHFEGRGSGHRVGLCVAGAAELARRGLDHRAILARYFPGTTVGTR